MALLNRKKIKSMPQRNKDLVFGHLRQEQKQNDSNYPYVIQALCLLYFNPDQETFDSSSNFNQHIDIQPHTVIGYNTQCDLIHVDARSICLKNVVKEGIHIWKFKVTYSPHTAPNKGELILESISQVLLDGNSHSPPKKFGIGWMLNTTMVVMEKGTEINAEKIAVWEDKYKVKSKDTVEFKYDGNAQNIYIKINDRDFFQIVDGRAVWIPKVEYRLKLRVYGGDRIQYDLLSYEQTM